MGFESSGFEHPPGDVVSQIPKAEDDAAEVFESAVERFGWSVDGAGPVEVAEDVGALFEGAGGFADFDEFGGHSGTNLMNRVLQEVPSQDLGLSLSYEKKNI